MPNDEDSTNNTVCKPVLIQNIIPPIQNFESSGGFPNRENSAGNTCNLRGSIPVLQEVQNHGWSHLMEDMPTMMLPML
jgi:hypothetical protein